MLMIEYALMQLTEVETVQPNKPQLVPTKVWCYCNRRTGIIAVAAIGIASVIQ